MSTVTVQGSAVSISHPEKVLFPNTGMTKEEYIGALALLAPYLLPHTTGQPLTAIRYPHGVGDEFFYQKRPPKGTPGWVSTTTDGSGDTFINLDSLKTLMWLGNSAALEFHVPFCNQGGMLTSLVFDLDPSEGQTFEDVTACALSVFDTMKELGVTCYAKTSGASGLQIYIPTRRMTFEEGRTINAFFGRYFQAKHPDTVTVERLVKNRGRRLYFDYLQMGHGKSIISVYSPRAVPCGAVSMPVTWDELEKGAKPCDFTLGNAAERLKKTGDLFAPMLSEGRPVPALEEILKKQPMSS